MRALLLSLGLILTAGAVCAQDSAVDASKLAGATSQLATDLGASGVKTVVGTSAAPVGFVAAGSAVGGSAVAVAGVASIGAGAGASQMAGASADATTGPLKVDDRVVVADPAPQVPYAPAKPK